MSQNASQTALAVPISPEEVQSMGAASGAVMRINQSEMAMMARQAPRDRKLVLANVIAELEGSPELVENALYKKPVGKDDSGKQTFATGLSIRAAECLYQAWGNCAVTCKIVETHEDYTDLEAIFIDYERCVLVSRPIRVSRFYTKRGGGRVRHGDDRFADCVIPGAASRGIREATMRGLPPSLKAAVVKKIEELQVTRLDPTRVANIILAFSAMGVAQPTIEKHMGKRVVAFTAEDRGTLAGIFEAIRDGEITVEEAFPGNGHSEAPPANGLSAASTKVKPNEARIPPGEKPATPPPANPKPAPDPAAPPPEPQPVVKELFPNDPPADLKTLRYQIGAMTLRLSKATGRPAEEIYAVVCTAAGELRPVPIILVKDLAVKIWTTLRSDLDELEA